MDELQVFISWSGQRSLEIASAIKEWLPDVLRNAEPWLSTDDLRKGLQWNAELTRRLSSSRVGLLVITEENKDAPWVLFEAGALSKALPGGRCCPVLCDLKPTDLIGPLTQFQATTLNRQDMFRLVKSIGEVGPDLATDESRLNRWFEQAWPSFESNIQRILARRCDITRDVTGADGPSDRELLEEVVGTLHRLGRDLSEIQHDSIGHAVKGPLICSPSSLLARFSDLPLVEQERLLHRMAVAKEIIFEYPDSELQVTENDRTRIVQEVWKQERQQRVSNSPVHESATIDGQSTSNLH